MIPQQTFLLAMRDAAKTANHIWPEYAACEAANATNYGASDAFTKANNIFGTRARASWMSNPNMLPKGIGVISLPAGTRIINGRTVVQMGDFARFDDPTAAFKYRMDTLDGLQVTYYAALRAKSGEQYVIQVCALWNKLDVTEPPETSQNIAEFSDGYYEFVKARWYADPGTATAVMAIYNENASIFDPPPVVQQPAPVVEAPAQAEETK